MASRKFEEALNAIADGIPVAWSEMEGSREVAQPEFESLHLLQDIAHAFRASEASTVSEHPTAQFRWGTLQVERLLGSGSFGEVWHAFDPWLGRAVALKLQRAGPDAFAHRGAQLDEARRLARVRHPNVLNCYGCAVHDGRAGLWSELVDGRPLAAVVADDGALSIEEALRIGRDLARALAAVHAVGLVHGDIKAGNVLRETGGRIVLMDFGAGGEERLLASRRLVSGTPAYLAPEVLDGAPLSRRSDYYALGVLLFLLLTGRLPYAQDSVEDLRRAQREGRRANLAELRPDLDARALAAIEQCLDMDPARRPQDAAAIAMELAPALPGARTHAAALRATARWRYAIGGTLLASLLLAFAWPFASVPQWTVDAGFVRSRGQALEPLVDSARVNVGDHLRLRLHSNRTNYVYVLNEDAGGNATVLYPVDGAIARALPASDEILLPDDARGSTLAWEITGDSAREEFLVVSALEPVREIDALLANWNRVANGAPDRATRSVGAVIEESGTPVLQGTHLNDVLGQLDKSGSGIRTWRFRFEHQQ
jgi:hypothetical protein